MRIGLNRRNSADRAREASDRLASRRPLALEPGPGDGTVGPSRNPDASCNLILGDTLPATTPRYALLRKGKTPGRPSRAWSRETRPDQGRDSGLTPAEKRCRLRGSRITEGGDATGAPIPDRSRNPRNPRAAARRGGHRLMGSPVIRQFHGVAPAWRALVTLRPRRARPSRRCGPAPPGAEMPDRRRQVAGIRPSAFAVLGGRGALASCFRPRPRRFAAAKARPARCRSARTASRSPTSPRRRRPPRRDVLPWRRRHWRADAGQRRHGRRPARPRLRGDRAGRPARPDSDLGPGWSFLPGRPQLRDEDAPSPRGARRRGRALRHRPRTASCCRASRSAAR